MKGKTKLTMVVGVLALGLLAIPVTRRFVTGSSPSETREGSIGGTLPTKGEGTGSRAVATGTWKLPFRPKSRLTAEQAAILASGRVGAHLREHPQEVDLLVAWAAADPEAAKAWLAAVGEIEVDGVGYYYGHLAALAAGIFAHGGIAEMQQLLDQHRQDPLLPPKFQDGGFAAHPWFLMAREDTAQEAVAYLQAHPEKSEKAGQFLAGIEDTGRMLAALDYFDAKGINCSPDYWQLGSRVEQDGSLLADWAAASRPELLEDVLLGWNTHRPEEVRKWIDSHASRPELAPALEEVRKFVHEPAR